jgi:hypothetical protein
MFNAMRRLAFFLMFANAPLAAQEPSRADFDFFELKIRPILSEHCFACHSADADRRNKLKAGLRLDSPSALRRGGESGPPILPGEPAKSLLIRALKHEGDIQMPPKGKLPANVIADFVRWIERGAVDPRREPAPSVKERAWQTHWAFQPIRKPPLPSVTNKAWIASPIDAFVLARLEAQSLAPAPPADAVTLLRRLYVDLVGLPPSPDEIAAFATDPAAFPAIVEKLLASQHYGERWGRHWLDVVRYADSDGFELDTVNPHAWRYRDYVIRAFHSNKPLDRFLHEQIAGDELWPKNEEALLATGFATVGPMPHEGGIQRQRLIDYQHFTDLTDTTGFALLGLTLSCARCHNHKYDPISQDDYFGIQAIFAASEGKNVKLAEGEAKVLVRRVKPESVSTLRRGELEHPIKIAAPALPRAFPGGGELRGVDANERTMLARWLTSAENPLTARVLANRVWQWHFGKPLVRTPNDFGLQGEPPTHSELLDFLASELMSSHWNLRHVHQLILTSNAYRMSSQALAREMGADPDHRLLTRYPRRRLEAETVWDHLHAAAGTLNTKTFGPAVVPPLPPEATGILLNTKWRMTEDRKEWTRRGLYLIVRRSMNLPWFETFNRPLPIESCGGRETTVVAGQALALLNGPIATEQARFFAGRLLRECGNDTDAIVERAWLLAFSRTPQAEERAQARTFLEMRERADAKLEPLGERGAADVPRARAAAVVEMCLGLMNANEFLYVD